ncbi:MAG: 4Fe-4S dicluster domain-containing protein [Deltaproteobacteria bacterium]|nr:4Fe-4S dicluster domain-containing protein [Deltaproteobacteria bacterium]
MKPEPQDSLYVRFHEERCTGCAECLKVCPTKAIRIRQQKSVRFVDQCIGCSACLRVCPAAAVGSITRMPEDIGRDHVAIALVSPVLYAQFPRIMPGGVLMALRQMGFHHTVDMSFFFEMFQYAAAEFIRRNRTTREAPWPLISPACPVVVRLIAFQFPSLLPHILPVLRPVALMAREVRERVIPEYESQKQDVVLYYINPCPTKSTSGQTLDPHRSRCREVAIGINDIYPALKPQVEKVLSSDNMPFSWTRFEFETCSTADAAFGAMSGGEIARIEIEDSLAVHGLKETVDYLNKIEMGLLKDIEYIEFRTCREACLGGALAVVDKYIAKRHVQKMTTTFGMGRRLPQDALLRQYEQGRFKIDKSPDVLRKFFSSCKPTLSLADAERIEQLVANLGNHNCGACGAPGCRVFAEDVVLGQAELNECIWLSVHGLVRGRTG